MWFGEGTAERGAKGSEGCSVYWWAMGEGFRHQPCRGPASWMGAQRGKMRQAGERRKIGAS